MKVKNSNSDEIQPGCWGCDGRDGMVGALCRVQGCEGSAWCHQLLLLAVLCVCIHVHVCKLLEEIHGYICIYMLWEQEQDEASP